MHFRKRRLLFFLDFYVEIYPLSFFFDFFKQPVALFYILNCRELNKSCLLIFRDIIYIFWVLLWFEFIIYPSLSCVKSKQSFPFYLNVGRLHVYVLFKVCQSYKDDERVSLKRFIQWNPLNRLPPPEGIAPRRDLCYTHWEIGLIVFSNVCFQGSYIWIYMWYCNLISNPWYDRFLDRLPHPRKHARSTWKSLRKNLIKRLILHL